MSQPRATWRRMSRSCQGSGREGDGEERVRESNGEGGRWGGEGERGGGEGERGGGERGGGERGGGEREEEVEVG